MVKRDKASTPLETLLMPDTLFFHSLAKAGGAVLWSQAQNMMTCPAHPAITQTAFLFFFSFFFPHCSCHLFLRLKPKRESRSPRSEKATHFTSSTLLSASLEFLLLSSVHFDPFVRWQGDIKMIALHSRNRFFYCNFGSMLKTHWLDQLKVVPSL